MKRITVICDRCLKECEEGKSISLINVLTEDYDAGDYRRDLCLDCYDEFNRVFMTEKKAAMMAEPEPDDQPCPPMPKGEKDDETSRI